MAKKSKTKTKVSPKTSASGPSSNQDGKVVATLDTSRGLTIGKPTQSSKRVSGGMSSRLTVASMRDRVAASCGPGTGSFGGVGGGGGGGISMGGGGISGNFGPGAVTQASSGNFYSPELSTDFLELPQSLNEQWNYFRFFYANEPFVGQAIDLHNTLPLSKIRLARPVAKSQELAQEAMEFCDKWARRVDLLEILKYIVHDYTLLGEAFVFCEDTNPDMPKDVYQKVIREQHEDGSLREKWVPRDNADEAMAKWLRKNYKGWTNIRILPPEQIHIETFPFTDEVMIEVLADSKTKHLINMADQGDPRAQKIVSSMDRLVVESVREGGSIPLSTDPDAGSFVHYMANKSSQYQPRGHSLLQRCLLPGTMMTILRQTGHEPPIAMSVPVETVDIKTDSLLTHKGRFRPATMGSRFVDEPVAVIDIQGIPKPLAITSDHEVMVIRADGTEAWVQAKDLREGDHLRESHYQSESPPIREIDLGDWWRNRTIYSSQRLERGKSSRALRVVEVESSDEISVVFEYDNDNLNEQEALVGMGKFVAWLKQLPSPTEVSYTEISAILDVSPSKLRNYAHTLRKSHGLKSETRSLGRGLGQRTMWWPLAKDFEIPRMTHVHTLTSKVSNIVLDESFCYLLGTWLGDGNLWTSSSTFLDAVSIAWSTGIAGVGPKVKARILDAVVTHFGQDALVEGHLFGNNPSTESFRVEDPLLAQWFLEEFGHSAQTKRLPFWVFNLDAKCICALMQGILDTDGCIYVKGDKASIRVTLDNPMLVEQLHMLSAQAHIPTNIGKATRKKTQWKRSWETISGVQEKTYEYGEKTYPFLSATTWEGVSRWAAGSIKGAPHEEVFSARFRETISQESRWHGSNLIRRVRSVTLVPYQGPVYSFDVEEDESHVTNGVVTHNCLRVLVYFDKLRQAQTSIASRHMTPVRLVYAPDMSESDTEQLREQIDLALMDPDYSIVTNFQVTWEELNSNGRLLELSGEYDLIGRQLYAGLGVTEALLTGESSYSGERINLEVINTRYMMMRERLQTLVEEKFFKPMCRRMGFVEEDDYGNLEVVYPRLSFTRLAWRDNQDTFDALFQLYQKGSLDIETIYDLLNIDPITVRERLERDFATINDANFNEVIRSMFGRVGDNLVENSDIVEKVAEHLKLKYKKPSEGEDPRF